MLTMITTTVLDANDNCPLTANTNQGGQRSRCIGDACDHDDDNDGVPDATDNCPLTANTDQADNDNDGQSAIPATRTMTTTACDATITVRW